MNSLECTNLQHSHTRARVTRILRDIPGRQIAPMKLNFAANYRSEINESIIIIILYKQRPTFFSEER